MSEVTRRTVLSLAAAASLPAIAAAADPIPVHVDDPPPGKATVVFYRRWTYPGGVLSFKVREGKTDLGVLDDGSYFIVQVDPGLHTFSVRAERSDDMQLVADAGEIYYVRLVMDIGWVLYQPTLTPSEQRLFDEISAKLTANKALPPKVSAAPPPPTLPTVETPAMVPAQPAASSTPPDPDPF